MAVQARRPAPIARGINAVGVPHWVGLVWADDPLFVDPWSSDYRLYAASPAAGLEVNGYPLGAFGAVPDSANLAQITLEPYAPEAPAPRVCPVAVNLITGEQVVPDIDSDGLENDCFPGAYGAPVDVPLPANMVEDYPLGLASGATGGTSPAAAAASSCTSGPSGARARGRRRPRSRAAPRATCPGSCPTCRGCSPAHTLRVRKSHP